MKQLLTAIFLLTGSMISFSQELSGTLFWKDNFRTETTISGKVLNVWPCTNCIFSDDHPGWPLAGVQFPLTSYGELSVNLRSEIWEKFTGKIPENIKSIPENYQMQTNVAGSRGKYQGSVSIPVIRKNNSGEWEVLKAFSLQYSFKPVTFSINRNDWTTTSVLSAGQNYKISVSSDGMVKLDYNYFKNTLGIDPASVDPRQIKIYGNPGGMLPTLNSVYRPDDLIENAIYFSGEDDGVFDQGDYLLFYASGPNPFKFNNDTKVLSQEINLYSSKNFYFVQLSGGNGKRIQQNNNNNTPEYWVNTFLEVRRLEEEKFNLLDTYEYAQGSGRKWFGDAYGPGTEKKYDSYFNFNNISLTDTVVVTGEFAGRSSQNSRFNLTIAGKAVNTSEIPGTSLGDTEGTFAYTGKFSYSFLPVQGQISLTAKYNAGSNSTGWLDFIEIDAYKKLIAENSPVIFQNPKTLNYTHVGYEIESGTPGLIVWNITDEGNIIQEKLNFSGSAATFINTPTSLQRFVAFYPSGNFSTAEFAGKIENQNLHGIESTQLVILYEKTFEEQVLRLKNQREKKSGLKVEAVRIDQLYNEFSGGRQDITAIRDFARMLYNRSADFKYLLLFGDGTFDYKNILNNQPHLNFIPVFETLESTNPIYSFPSDDYYGLLDPEEDQNLKGTLDIAIGRFPVNNSEQAENAVNKIIHYENNPVCLRDWRNRIVFSADDEDSNQHLGDSDSMAKKNAQNYPSFNQDKIYLDAFQQISTPGGDRIPEANNAINNDIFRGCLVFNYLGHGGPKGLAQERVVTISDINSWTNYDKLTLFITATCTFTGYDDPSIESGGEQTFNSTKGGAIALLTTTRAVFASSNAELVRSVYDTIFVRPEGEILRLGEVCRIAKTKFSYSASVSNARKFCLIGDPSLQLALPKHIVETNLINGKPADFTYQDTIKALQKVTVEGSVKDYKNNLIDNFNGKLYVTVFDKKKDYKTLGQDKGSPVYNFTLQKSVIFKGVTSVNNGKFSFTFIVPKDIDYKFGEGKISYYAENGSDLDAAGYFDKVIIGGSSNDAVSDNEPPKVQVFLNDDNFVKGGLTDKNPIIIAKISDDLGINITGSSIGHDLTAVIDENTQNEIILNDFYESVLDNPAKGTVKYPLSEIAPGTHTLRVKAWDITNKSGEGTTEFVVAENGVIALDHVLNYPNPFTTNTSFQFEHNFGNKNLHARISIYSVSGSLVKTIHQDVSGTGSRIAGIQWDGKDDFGNDLAKGVYIYKILVSEINTGTGSKKAESGYEKLVILK